MVTKVNSGMTTGLLATANNLSELNATRHTAHTQLGLSQVNVAQTVSTDELSIATTVLTDTGVACAITPEQTANKVLVTVSCILSGSGNDGYVTLYRDAVDLTPTDETGFFTANFGAAAGEEQHSVSFSYLDSPSSTSALSYKIYWKRSGSGTVYMGRNNAGNRFSPIVLTVMEVG